MFRSIERSLALQFTTFVLALLMINGAVFFAIDFSNQKRLMHQRLEKQMFDIQDAFPRIVAGEMEDLYLSRVERVRVLDAKGETVFSGELFDESMHDPVIGYSTVLIDGEAFTLLTEPIVEDGEVRGYVQIAEPERMTLRDLRLRASLYMLISMLISLLTYLVGLKFAKRSLQPAKTMFVRLEQFTQDASHELRTPLAVLGSSLDLALKTKQYREGIESAKEDLHQISDLVERLLEIARIGTMALEKTPIDLSLLVRTATKKFCVLAEKSGLTLTSSIDDGVVVNADETLVHQVIWNLLGNAVKFSHRGGRVSVTLDHRSLTVADEGVGIRAADLPRIFERFYQADTARTGNGSGLGLALVKQVVDMHGWTIAARSTEGKGTSFEVRFGKEKGRNS